MSRVDRPEYVKDVISADAYGVVEKPLTIWEKIWNRGGFRKSILLIVLAGVWQAYALYLDNWLLVPTFTSTVEALWQALLNDALIEKSLVSIQTLLIGYCIGVVLATLLTVFAITTTLGNDFLETLTAMFNPLPAIALLPLALIWFGLGVESIIFVLVHSVLWPVALNTHSGFKAMSSTLRMVGRNYGLSGFNYVWRILIPGTLPSIISGLKIGWAFAWRTLIAAELVFGVSSGSGGLGWFIYESKNALDIPSVFAGLFTVIVIGLVVENVIFRNVEEKTVKRWGMQT